VKRKLSLKEKLGSVLRRRKSFDDSDGDNIVADKNDKKIEASNIQPKAPATPVKAPEAEVVKIGNQIATLQDGLGRIETSITKAVTASSTGFEESIKSLMQKLDDVVISMQATQSDRNSPFNSSSLVQELPESVGLAGEEQKVPQQSQPQQQGSTSSSASGSERNPKSSDNQESSSPSQEHPKSLGQSIADLIQDQKNGEEQIFQEEDQIRELLRSRSSRRLPSVSNRLQDFVKSCALLEIVDGDHKRLNYLYDIGILRTEDLETASRIIDLLGRYSPNLKPVDLAIIACSIEETAASDRETRKLLAIATALNKSR
jgi:hypothetical protein